MKIQIRKEPGPNGLAYIGYRWNALGQWEYVNGAIVIAKPSDVDEQVLVEACKDLVRKSLIPEATVMDQYDLEPAPTEGM